MAEQSFKNIIELFAEAAEVLSNHASVLSRQYRHDEAEAAIRLAIALHPARPEFSHLQAETLA